MSFVNERVKAEGLTFDDVLLVPAYSEVMPKEVNVKAKFSRNIELNIPIVSAAMDTVTEAKLAASLAQEGGIGVIHKNMSIEAQAAQVRAVKTAEIVGKNACVDAQGRLRVAAGVGLTPDAAERVSALVEAGADAVVLDSAHGHSIGMLRKLQEIKSAFPGLDVIAGNVATGEAAEFLIEGGADGVKVGIGPGSICTTRIVAGIGMPQLTAVFDAAKAAAGTGVPVIADGGLRYSGDVVKALAAGGDCVMVGSMFAGTEEAPGDTIIDGDRKFKTYRGMGSVDAMKAGSADRYFQKDAEKNFSKLVPEGVVARVPYKGLLSEVVYQLMGGVRAGMFYCGAKDIEALHHAGFVRITASGIKESHPHDVTITCEAPNYK